MKKLILTLFLILLSVNAIKISYDSQVLIVPGNEKDVSILIDDVESKLIWTSCNSNLTLTCPSFININPQGQSELKIHIQTTSRGTYPVDVKIGKERIKFEVIVANQTTVFFNTLTNYQKTFSRLEEMYGVQPLLDKGFSLIGGGWNLYADEDYLPINGVLTDLQKTLSDFYETLKSSEPENEEVSEPIQLGGSFISIILLSMIALVFSLYKLKFKKKHVDNTIGLKKFIRKEIEGLRYG